MNTQLPKDEFTLSYGLDQENKNSLFDQMDSLMENIKYMEQIKCYLSKGVIYLFHSSASIDHQGSYFFIVIHSFEAIIIIQI